MESLLGRSTSCQDMRDDAATEAISAMPATKPSAAEITTAPSAEAVPEAANRADQLRR